MNIFSKKFLILFCGITMIISNLLSNVSAKEFENQYDDIMEYVVSGSGTFEDPYVFESLDNQYSLMFNEIVKDSIIQKPFDTRHQFTASLTGDEYYNQTNGGEWHYSYGGGSVGTNNSFVYVTINYVNEKDTENTYVALTNPSLKDIIYSSVRDNAFELMIEKVTEKAGKTMAKAVYNFFSVIPVVEIINSSTLDELGMAVYNDNGSLVVKYKFSYNGAWYYNIVSVEWDTYPTAILPGTAYGVGNYKSR